MTRLEKVLDLVPANAASRLGAGSQVVLLNPRDLARSIASAPAALVCVPVNVLPALPGLLRAARDEDAPLGLAYAPSGSDRGGPSRFFDAVRAAVEGLRHWRPLFLEAGPLRIERADASTLERAQAQVFEWVDAGFSAVSLDAATLEPEEAAEAYRQAAQALLERELTLEVAAPEVDGRASSDHLGRLLEALGQVEIRPGYVRVPAGAPLLALAEVARSAGTRICLDEREAFPAAEARAWVEAGVRKVRASHRFASAAEDRPPERVEALWYGEASDLLVAAGCRGAGSRAVGFLAEQAGY